MVSHIEMLANEDGSNLARQNAPEIIVDDFPKGWDGQSMEFGGVFMLIFTIQPDAVEFPLHSSEDTWLAYVVTGSGTLIAGDNQENKTQEMQYKAGDFITFDANTPHGWKNDNQLSKILCTKSLS